MTRDNIEQGFIDYLIVHPEYLGSLQIKSKYLYYKQNRDLLESLIDSYKKYKRINLTKIQEDNPKFDMNYYFQVVTEAVYDRNLQDYEESILNAYKKDIVKELNQKLSKEEITFKEFTNKIKKVDDYQLVEVQKLTEEEIYKNLNSNKRIEIKNYTRLNETLKLVQNDFMIIGATTGAGKSSFLINLMNSLLDDYQCIYFNLEMSKSTIYQRLVGIRANLQINDVAKPQTDHQENIIKNTIKELTEKDLIIEHQTNDIKQIKSLIAKVKKDKHTIVFIDHIGLLTVEGNRPLYEKATEIAKTIRQISLNYDCTIISASQLNRTAYSSDSLNISMLKDSGEMENSASKIILLQKQTIIDEFEKITELDVEVAKNRDGFVGLIKFEYQKKKQIFKERLKQQ